MQGSERSEGTAVPPQEGWAELAVRNLNFEKVFEKLCANQHSRDCYMPKHVISSSE